MKKMSQKNTVLLIDGAQWYATYFQSVFTDRNWTISCNLKLSKNVTVIISSFFGNDIAVAKQRWPAAYQIFVAGEPNHVHFKGVKTAPHLILDCKDVPSRRWPESKFLYLPFFALHFVERVQYKPEHLLHRPTSEKETLSILQRKTKFCAFMYSHDVDHRNALFHNLNKFVANIDAETPNSKLVVDALGKCCNANANKLETDRRVYQPGRVTFYDLAVDKYRDYKFVICCENEVGLPGYITEKIINAYLANAIPIYRGAPDVATIFNPKSFINGNDLTDKQVADQILKIQSDDVLYRQMLQEPVFNALPSPSSSSSSSKLTMLPQWFDKTLYSNQIQMYIQDKLSKTSHISPVKSRNIGTKPLLNPQSLLQRKIRPQMGLIKRR